MKFEKIRFSTPEPIRISFPNSPELQPRTFLKSFRIGRSPECEVCLPNDYVSRVHAQVTPEKDGWRICDLNSSNGLYSHGVRVSDLLIELNETVRLGADGPELAFAVQHETSSEKSLSEEEMLARYANRYFGETADEESIGEHTMYVRRAFAKVQNQQRKEHGRQKGLLFALIGMLVLAGAGISVYAYRLYVEKQQRSELARNLFYSMKSLDVEIAESERLALETNKQQGIATVNKYDARRKDMQADYDRFLASLHIYDPKSSEQHRLILRVARIFGECELDMPADFEQEILKYIKYWQSSGRYARDIQLAKEKGYTSTIPQALLQHGLPVQFFYLAMQESDFNPYASGPMTRKGIAKGMWQFIPDTGVSYGLHLGPLVDLGRPDPSDERDQVDKSTEAAAKYISTLYATDAQASGLLVMACYNWGEFQVLPLVRSMPLNPRQRNFWKLLAEHREQLPQQTYDYVFYITAAAVIGENPRLFGFDFDNPLEPALQSASGAGKTSASNEIRSRIAYN